MLSGRGNWWAAPIVCAVLAGAGQAPGQAWAQTANTSPTSVTVFDAWFEPYTAYGRAEAGGAVIVFDSPARPALTQPAPQPSVIPLAPATLSPAVPDLGPPIETAAGKTTQATPQAAPAQQAPQAGPQPASGPAPKDQYVEGNYAIKTDYWLSYPQNLYRIVTSPARFDESDWITAALVVGAGTALLLLDEPLQDFWQGDVKSDTTEGVFDVFREFGESRNIIFGSLAAYAVAETLDSTGVVDARREKSAALLTLESFLLTQGLITGMKYVTGRERPEDSDDAFDFQGPSKNDTNASFPSGHAGSAFALASVISATYGDTNPWVPYVAYTAATGTALARVDDNRHWFSDVFVGGAIGYFVGHTVVRYSPFLARNNISLRPFSYQEARGVGVGYKF